MWWANTAFWFVKQIRNIWGDEQIKLSYYRSSNSGDSLRSSSDNQLHIVDKAFVAYFLPKKTDQYFWELQVRSMAVWQLPLRHLLFKVNGSALAWNYAYALFRLRSFKHLVYQINELTLTWTQFKIQNLRWKLICE